MSAQTSSSTKPTTCSINELCSATWISSTTVSLLDHIFGPAQQDLEPAQASHQQHLRLAIANHAPICRSSLTLCSVPSDTCLCFSLNALRPTTLAK